MQNRLNPRVLFAFFLLSPDVITGAEKRIQAGPQGATLVFLSAKCPCSDSHIHELQQLASQYPKVQFVGVHSNSNEPPEMARTYFQSKKLPFPVLQDQDGKIAEQYRALKTPHAFVIDPSGKILYQGGVSNSADAAKADRHFLKDALEDLSQGRLVKTPTGRTLGCVIKRKKS